MNELSLLFKNDVPLMDVRAPVEFLAGHFPHSNSLPLMNDEERRLVGTCYKESGQAAAIALGHHLVQGDLQAQRVDRWVHFIRQHPQARLYCFRGGLRSQISQQWIRERGVKIDIIPGGYKRLRRFLMEVLEESPNRNQFWILAGRTGSGKTELLKKIQVPVIDLEKHAHHKGSSFGAHGPQPSQITFENAIAVDLLKLGSSSICVEDESVMIGSLVVPRSLFQVMRNSPLVVLERTREERVSRIIQEYLIEQNHTMDFMLNALGRIQKKLGGLNYSRIATQIKDAYFAAGQSPTVDRLMEVHRAWVGELLVHYYDPFYDRGLHRQESRIVFRGNEVECKEFLEQKVRR